MIPLTHRLILYICSITLLLSDNFTASNFLLALCMLAYLCSLILIKIPKFTMILKLAFILSTGLAPSIALFTPSLFYEQKDTPIYLNILLLFPILFLSQQIIPLLLFLIILLSILSYFLSVQTQKNDFLTEKLLLSEDVSKELSLLMQKRNQELQERQEMEIHMARLNERNRISKDIHDNLGHLLTRSLLQVGALITTTNNHHTKSELSTLQTTLDEGMLSVRKSIHGLYADSFDLNQEIKKLTESFTFCKVEYYYSLNSILPTNMKLSFLSIIKEALNNTMKHSNATQLTVTLRENAKNYVLFICDNGTTETTKFNNGIGITSIEERVRLLNGIFNIQIESGCRIYIAIPKEDRNENHNH